MGCRHNLFLDIEGRNIRFPHGEVEPDQVQGTLCSLDYADYASSRIEVESHLQISRNIIREVEISALRKLGAQSRMGRGLREFQIVVPREDHWDTIELMG